MDPGEPFFSTCKAEGERPGATVAFSQEEPGVFHGSNVIARSRPRLSVRGYNDLLTEFCDRFVRPAALKTGATVELTENQTGLERWLSPVVLPLGSRQLPRRPRPQFVFSELNTSPLSNFG
jgi:hypothetical protein